MSLSGCSHLSICAGCEWVQLPLAKSFDIKLKSALHLFEQHNGYRPQNIESILFNQTSYRDRLDVVLDSTIGYKLGYYHRTNRDVFDLYGCPLLTPELEGWFQEFRALGIPFKLRGSLRLRIGARKQKGIWFDFANADIKSLLDQHDYLERLSRIAAIEIGQKKKTLNFAEDRLRLQDFELGEWFTTLNPLTAQKIPLFATVGGFTQPGHDINQLLVKTLLSFMPLQPMRILEIGSGIGNFTVPLALMGHHIIGLENDFLSLKALSKNRELYGLGNKIEILHPKDPIPETDLLFADPPRSGLTPILKSRSFQEMSPPLPSRIVLMSCAVNGWVQDAETLKAMGYELQKVKVVDLFPRTTHLEIVSQFERVL